MLSSACKTAGIPLGFHSSIMDWRHPDDLPRRGWERDTCHTMKGRPARYHESCDKARSQQLVLQERGGEAAALCGTLLGGLGAIVGGLIGAGAGVDQKIEISSADPISIGRVVAQLRPLARDRG